MCERFGFVGDRQWTPVGDLSGGERRRLQLLRLLMDEPNVLLLDEPTNDLDIDTLTALEDLLDGWAGLAARGVARPLLPRAGLRPRGGAARRRSACATCPAGWTSTSTCAESARAAAPADVSEPRGAGGGREADSSAGEVRAARKELARLERQLEKLRERETKVYAEMAAAASDHERVLGLDAALRGLRDERAVMEDRWLELADQVD